MSTKIELILGKRAVFSPREFAELPENVRKALGRVYFEPPELGTSGFGRFIAEFRYPVYGQATPSKQVPRAKAVR